MQLVQQTKNIQNKIYTIRGLQVMVDRDLAELYGVETKRINEAVKNNPDKFPNDFYFKLEDLRSKLSTTNFSKTRINPKVFTEQGIYMLATVLKSKVASQIIVSIIRTFASMRKIIESNTDMFQRFEREDKSLKPKQGIFYNGQVFDAYNFVAGLIRSSKESITLIDNYINDTTLTLFSKNQDIDVIIYTQTISKQLKLDLEKYNTQYKNITIKPFKDSHDRFMIIDNKEVYHIEASLKDLGKKWFGFSRFDVGAFGLMKRLECS